MVNTKRVYLLLYSTALRILFVLYLIQYLPIDEQGSYQLTFISRGSRVVSRIEDN